MKITNNQIVSYLNGIEANGMGKKNLPVGLSYALIRNLKAFEPAAMAYEEERKKILDRYVAKGEDGKPVIKDKAYVFEDQEAYAEAMNELLNIENDVQIHTVKFADVEKCDTEQFDSLSMSELALIDFMIE